MCEFENGQCLESSPGELNDSMNTNVAGRCEFGDTIKQVLLGTDTVFGEFGPNKGNHG